MRTTRVLIMLVLLAAAGSAGTYTLQLGDTLGGVAARFGLSVDILVSANHIEDPDVVQAGQVLTIPSGAPAAAPAPAPALHRVAAGETLGSIARRYGTTVAVLAQLNGIRNVNVVPEGAVLRLPGPAWLCPVQGPVTFVSGFGEPRGDGRRHDGVDLAAPRGTPVVASVSGVVEQRPNPYGGLAYWLQGDNGDIYYGAHLDRYVGAGGRVALGQAIGTVGDSGNAKGGINHLHFARHPGGGPVVDPYPLLARACVKASRGA